MKNFQAWIYLYVLIFKNVLDSCTLFSCSSMLICYNGYQNEMYIPWSGATITPVGLPMPMPGLSVQPRKKKEVSCKKSFVFFILKSGGQRALCHISPAVLLGSGHTSIFLGCAKMQSDLPASVTSHQYLSTLQFQFLYISFIHQFLQNRLQIYRVSPTSQQQVTLNHMW